MPAFDALKIDERGPTQSATSARHEFAQAVWSGLTKPQRELPSIYLYDELGTALFEAITELPEYGLARADERLLRRYAQQILEHLPPSLIVAELGSGSGRKTRWLLEALSRRDALVYFPIDISAVWLGWKLRTLKVSVPRFPRVDRGRPSWFCFSAAP